jgi:hypothetical protein
MKLEFYLVIPLKPGMEQTETERNHTERNGKKSYSNTKTEFSSTEQLKNGIKKIS